MRFPDYQVPAAMHSAETADVRGSSHDEGWLGNVMSPSVTGLCGLDVPYPPFGAAPGSSRSPVEATISCSSCANFTGICRWSGIKIFMDEMLFRRSRRR